MGWALPAHYADQETLIAALQDIWAGDHLNPDRLEELHRSVQVSGRYLALPLAAYRELTSFASRNEAWTRAAVDLGEEAVREALRLAGLWPWDVEHLVFVTTTGIATPSIDARLVNRLRLRRDVRRSPLFGLGCAGGAVGISRASDLMAARPEQVAVLLSLELCSLTLQRDDPSVSNIIARPAYSATAPLPWSSREETPARRAGRRGQQSSRPARRSIRTRRGSCGMGRLGRRRRDGARRLRRHGPRSRPLPRAGGRRLPPTPGPRSVPLRPRVSQREA